MEKIRFSTYTQIIIAKCAVLCYNHLSAHRLTIWVPLLSPIYSWGNWATELWVSVPTSKLGFDLKQSFALKQSLYCHTSHRKIDIIQNMHSIYGWMDIQTHTHGQCVYISISICICVYTQRHTTRENLQVERENKKYLLSLI